jgi:hypothetical protein
LRALYVDTYHDTGIGQHRRQQVDQRPQLDEGQDLQRDGEREGGTRGDSASDQGPVLPPVDEAVDVPVVVTSSSSIMCGLVSAR